MSAASSLPDSIEEEADPNGPASEPSRPTDPRLRTPPMRDALSTLDEADFDFHDTIPAPPWLDEPLDASEIPPVPAR